MKSHEKILNLMTLGQIHEKRKKIFPDQQFWYRGHAGTQNSFFLICFSISQQQMVEWLFLAVPWGCLRFVIVVFPDLTHYFSVPKHTFCAVNTPSIFV